MTYTYFSIDPSIRACGWASLNEDNLQAGLCVSKEKYWQHAVLDIYEQIFTLCSVNIDCLIIERPIIQKNWTQQKIKSIEKLLVCYGTLLTIKAPHTRLWTPTVPEWKNQLPKKVAYSRAIDVLTNTNIRVQIVGKITDDLLHNTQDAIALLVRYLEKEGITHDKTF